MYLFEKYLGMYHPRETLCDRGDAEVVIGHRSNINKMFRNLNA